MDDEHTSGATRRSGARRRSPRDRWVVTERVQPQGEEGLRWVQLTYGRRAGWAAPPPARPRRSSEEQAAEAP